MPGPKTGPERAVRAFWRCSEVAVSGAKKGDSNSIIAVCDYVIWVRREERVQGCKGKKFYVEGYGSKSKKERKMQVSKRDLKQPGWSPGDKVKTADWDLLLWGG